MVNDAIGTTILMTEKNGVIYEWNNGFPIFKESERWHKMD
jgi:hypothetical protein